MEPALAAEQFWRLTAEPVAVMRQSRLPAVREAATAQVKQVQTKKTKKQNKKTFLVYCTRFIFFGNFAYVLWILSYILLTVVLMHSNLKWSKNFKE